MFFNDPSLTFLAVDPPDEIYLEPQNPSEDISPTIEDQQKQLSSCTVCFKVFPTLIQLQRHYIKHVVNKPFPCNECEKSFFTETALEKHARLHAEKPFSCEICQNYFLTESMLDAHLRKHTFPEFTCNLCFECFHKMDELHRHERSHSAGTEGSVESGCLPCGLCDFQFIYKRDLEDHMNTHEKVRDYTCEECGESFFFSYILQQHEKTHADREYCNVCAEAFSNLTLLSYHERIHLKPQLDDRTVLCFPCELCDAIYPFKTELEAHYNGHESFCRYPCTMCEQTFFFSCLCRKHKATHKEISQYECSLCRKMFRDTNQLKRHMHDSHSIEKKNSCPVCGKNFSSKRTMQQHCIIHADTKPHSCEFCKAGFSSKSNLERHYLVHMTEKQFKCPMCEFSFRQKGNLRDHLKQHEEGRDCSQCIVCEEKFASEQLVKRHTRMEHPEAKVIYVCDVCGKVFKAYTSFSIHYRLHTGTQPYRCKFCAKVFNQKRHLLRHHQFNHPDFNFEINLPFKCAYCHQAYIKQCGLVRHHKEQHPMLELEL